MPRYEVMREAIKDPAGGRWIPTLVWAYRAGERVEVRATPNAYHLEADYRARLDQARADGFKEDAIWAYWQADGGNGYTEIRTRPEGVEAPGLEAALQREIRKLQATPLEVV